MTPSLAKQTSALLLSLVLFGPPLCAQSSSPQQNPYSPQGVAQAIAYQLKITRDFYPQVRASCEKSLQNETILHFGDLHCGGGGFTIDQNTGLPLVDPTQDAFVEIDQCGRAIGDALGYFQLTDGADHACRDGQANASKKSNYKLANACWPQLLQSDATLDQALKDYQRGDATAGRQDDAQAFNELKKAEDCLKQEALKNLTPDAHAAFMLKGLPAQYGAWVASLSQQALADFITAANQAGIPQNIITELTKPGPNPYIVPSPYNPQPVNPPPSNNPQNCACETTNERQQVLKTATEIENQLRPLGGNLATMSSFTLGLGYAAVANLRSLAQFGVNYLNWAITPENQKSQILADQFNSFWKAGTSYATNSGIRDGTNAKLYGAASQAWQGIQQDFRTNPSFMTGEIVMNVAPLALCPMKSAAELQKAAEIANDVKTATQVAQVTEDVLTETTKGATFFEQEMMPAGVGANLPKTINGLPVLPCMGKNSCYWAAEAMDFLWATGENDLTVQGVYALEGKLDMIAKPEQFMANNVAKYSQTVLQKLAATGNNFYTKAQLDMIAKGEPIPVDWIPKGMPLRRLNHQWIEDALKSGGEGSRGMIFIKILGDPIEHSFNVRFLNGAFEYKDVLNKMIGSQWFDADIEALWFYPTDIGRI